MHRFDDHPAYKYGLPGYPFLTPLTNSPERVRAECVPPACRNRWQLSMGQQLSAGESRRPQPCLSGASAC